jgi:hypothetical protein
MPSILVSLVSIMAFTSLEIKPKMAKQQQGYISKSSKFKCAILMDF